MNKVAVYGTLKKGHGNHRLLLNAEFLGTQQVEGFIMYDLGAFPGIKPADGGTVHVEVYEVDDNQMARLDRLEGYNPTYPETGLYNRQQVATQYGDAWIYTYNGNVHEQQHVLNGNW